MKQILKKYLPAGILSRAIKLKNKLYLRSAFYYDYKSYRKHSTTDQKLILKDELQYRILKDYHAIEKGLTMPTPRMGFGVERIINIWKNCSIYMKEYSKTDKVVKDAFSTLLEYDSFHSRHDHTLSKEISEILSSVKNICNENALSPSKQAQITKIDFFEYANSDFKTFSNSRKSIRAFSKEDISLALMQEVIKLAQNAPSACNRQCSQAYLFTEKKYIQDVLKLQNGNTGFGDTANKLLVITSNLAAFYDPMERNQAYIDGGIYAMNLLYSLHYHKIGACMLNCSNTPKTDRELRKLCNISDSEVFIAMIVCGFPEDEFEYCLSPRNTLDFSQLIKE